MAKLTKWLDGFTTWVMKWARWGNPILMVLITFEVFMRYVLKMPTIWGGDVQTMLSAIGRMIGIGYGQMVRAHVIMDVFTAKLDFKKTKMLDIFNTVIFILPLLGALIYATLIRTIKSWRYKETIYSGWRPIIYPVVTLLVGCYLLLAIQAISEVIKDVISIQKGSDAWIKDR